jgi:hypothetical protein
MTEKIQNAPTPSLIYPKSAGLYLMSRVQELTANVADLIDTLVQRDQRIAVLEAENAEIRGAKAPRDTNPMFTQAKPNGAQASA